MPDPESEEHGYAHIGKRLSIEGFLVDFLGGLVPGIVFLFCASLALLPSLHILYAKAHATANPSVLHTFGRAIEATKNTPNTIWIAICFAVGFFAYLVGHLFYRHDVKEADASSFEWLVEMRKRSGQNDNEDWCKNELACESKGNCEFPYPDYSRYLKQRGLTHLLPFVAWEKNPLFRSKNYINTLKIRLHYHRPDKCGHIIKNEAHVRLASSSWYVARILEYVSCIGFFLTLLLTLLYSLSGPGSFWAAWGHELLANVEGLLSPIIVFALAFCATRAIRGFLHYQRLREVFFVLETAFTAFRDDYSLLDPPFDASKFPVQGQPLKGASAQQSALPDRGSSTPDDPHLEGQ